VQEPYGVWGGFTEAERLRLLALGWEDAADLRHRRVDLARLERRLKQRISSGAPRPPASRLPAQRAPADRRLSPLAR
jgi:WhiB family redox-sensing transcriptional regulator